MGKIEKKLEEIMEWLKKKEEKEQREEKDSYSYGGARGLWSVGKERENSSRV